MRTLLVLSSVFVVVGALLLARATPSFACAFSAGHYGLNTSYTCLGTWQQMANVLDNDSTVLCYNETGSLLRMFQSRKAYLNLGVKPPILENSGCDALWPRSKSVLLLLDHQIQGDTSFEFWASGDIYGQRKSAQDKRRVTPQ